MFQIFIVIFYDILKIINTNGKEIEVDFIYGGEVNVKSHRGTTWYDPDWYEGDDVGGKATTYLYDYWLEKIEIEE